MSAAMDTDNVFDLPTLGASSDTLKPGARSAEVADLQRNLQKLGFVGIPANGVYDKVLASIIVMVQRAIMRPETGEVDSFTEASITRAVSEPGSMEALRIGIAAREWGQSQGRALAAMPQSVQVVGDDAKPFYMKGEFWVAAAGIAGLFFFLKKTMEPTAVAPILSGVEPTASGDEDEGVEDPEEFFAGVGDKPRKKRKKRKAKKVEEADDLDGLEDGEVVDVEAKEVPADAPKALPEHVPAGDEIPAEVLTPAEEKAAATPAISDAPAPRKRKRRKGPMPKRGPNGAFLPRGRSLADALGEVKPKKRKKRKSRALAESAAGDVDEILGEAGDPEMDD